MDSPAPSACGSLLHRLRCLTCALTRRAAPDETVTFAHEGLTFTQATDGFGLLRVQIPALVAQAAILATFEDGEDVAQIATVSDLDAFDRVALQWTGPQALSLHALELGASYGDAGHVWTKAPKSTDRALLGQGGFLSRLGSGARRHRYLRRDIQLSFWSVFDWRRCAFDCGGRGNIKELRRRSYGPRFPAGRLRDSECHGCSAFDA